VWLGESAWKFLVAKVGVKTALSILTLPRKFLNALLGPIQRKRGCVEVADRDEGQEGGCENWGSQGRADLISAIGHPLRRCILRLLHDHDNPQSASKMARELEEPLGTTAYHARVLCNVAALKETGEQQVRGAIERFYASTIEDDPPIETLLEETREADEEAG